MSKRQPQMIVETAIGGRDRAGDNRHPHSQRDLRELGSAAVRQAYPETETAEWPLPGPVRQHLAEQCGDELEAVGDDGAALVADLLVVREQPTGDDLCRERAAEVGDGFEPAELGDEGFGAADPADAQAGPEQLAQRIRGENWRGRCEGGDWRRRLADDGEAGQRVVLQQWHLVLLNEVGEPAAVGWADHAANGILIGGNQVDEARAAAGEVFRSE